MGFKRVVLNLIFQNPPFRGFIQRTPVSKLLKKQKTKCNHCGLIFRDGDVWEVDHIIPRSLGGTNGDNNLQLLHRHCHDTKTGLD